MPNKQTFFLVNDQVKRNAINFISSINTDQEKPIVVEIKEKTRTIEQNTKLWPMLKDISDQVLWHGLKLSSEEWKHIFSATLNGQKSVPNLDGTGFIVLGKSTSQMRVSEMRDMIELMYAFGAEHGVTWSEKWGEYYA